MSAGALLALGAATVHEALGKRGWLGPDIVPLWPGARLAGRCRTVWTPPGDNLAVHLALESCAPGDVLCVATTGVWTHGLWGDVLTHAAQTRGVAGLVTSGGVRDIGALEDAGFGAFGRGIAAQGTAKRDRGHHQRAVALGGAVIVPGDWIVADRDGAVVVPDRAIATALAAAGARTDAEHAAITDIRRGETTLTALGVVPENAAYGGTTTLRADRRGRGDDEGEGT